VAKAISITGDALARLSAEAFDFVGEGFSRIFDPQSGAVTEWLRPPMPDLDLARQHDEFYRDRFPDLVQP
jgi:hypothetical protein